MKLTYTISNHETTNIWIENDILSKIDEIIEKENHSACLLLCDSTTRKLFSEKVIGNMSGLKTPFKIYEIDEGEKSKNTKTLIEIINYLALMKFDRKSAIIALGGGVVGDIATTVAALYNRGIDCIQIPTTLLSQVDASLGGKGAVNINTYKNVIGVIRQPKYVIIDPSLIAGLPKSQYISGMGEIIKYAIAMDKELFNLLLNSEELNNKTLEKVIKRCVELKMKAVEKDPNDTLGERAILNFGHTIGHAVELTTGISHGEAVAIGMVFAIKLSQKLKLLKDEDAKQAINLIKKYILPVKIKIKNVEQIFNSLQKDKKTISLVPTFILLSEIGKTVVRQSVPKELIEGTLEEITL